MRKKEKQIQLLSLKLINFRYQQNLHLFRKVFHVLSPFPHIVQCRWMNTEEEVSRAVLVQMPGLMSVSGLIGSNKRSEQEHF